MTIPKISVAIIAIVVTGILLTAVTSALLTSNQISTSGTITTVQTVNIGVYNDAACTQNCTSINWSTVAPGSTTNKTIYIKNTGTSPVTLSLTTNNWSLNANGPITLSWDKGGTQLTAGANATATLTLTVLSNITGITDFSFNIVITGTGP